MSHMHKDRRKFLIQSAGAVAAITTTSTAAAEYRYGVASGDPLADRIMLWTHAKVPNSIDSVPLTWQVSTSSTFDSLVATGRVTATADKAFTTKVDATGLSAGNTDYYRFMDALHNASPVGTTRTLPAASAASVKFAVFSCTLYSVGYFNVYDAAAKSGAQYAIHLGDYIYEYGADPTKLGNADAVALGRVTAPARDVVSIDDYRTRYALYRSDPNLQSRHAATPWITVWDDHEFANNAWVDGAENHSNATQGGWATRKAVAARVYHEWMPIRTPDATNLLKIYRRFDFGNIFTLHMVDTRIEGRDKQYDSYGDADLTDPTTSVRGMATPSSALDGTAVLPGVHGSGLGLVDDLNYADTIRRGYLLMTATTAAAKGEYVFVDTIKSRTYAATTGKTVTVAATGDVTSA